MRYYRIEIEGGRVFTSFEGGKSLPGALNVELDIPVISYASPMGAGIVRIWGISLEDIGQASDFNGKQIKVFGGMQKGLPLANPSQSGLLVQGYIFQAFGNWIGTDMTLDFIIQPGTGTLAKPKNFSFNWKKGDKLDAAIKATLSTAFPDMKQDVQISDKLVLDYDAPGFYQTLTQFATYIEQASKSIVGGDYPGVSILVNENTIIARDGTGASNPKQIQFQDMIGQPTWIDPLSVQFKAVMRADLKVSDSVTFPPAVATSSASGNSPLVNAKSVFQGTFQIKQVRHVGNFRQRDAASWVTVIDTFSTKKAA